MSEADPSADDAPAGAAEGGGARRRWVASTGLAGARPAAALAGLAGAGSVAALAAAGERWSTPLGDGAGRRLGAWAAVLLVVGLLALLVLTRLTWTGAADGRHGRRVALAVGVSVGAAAAAALVLGTARLVAVLADGTTVASIRPTLAGWLAPGALLVTAALAVAALDRADRARRAVGVVAALGVVAGIALGLRPVAQAGPALVADGSGDARSAADWERVRVVAPVGDVVYGAVDGRIDAVDERGRPYPVHDLTDVRPRLYTGHLDASSRDTLGDVPVALFAWADGLAVAGAQGVFAVAGPEAGRMLVALADGRSSASLEALRTAGVPLLAAEAGSPLLAAAPDGAGGLLLLTPGGLWRRTATGEVGAVPGTAELAAAGVDRAIVTGRADGAALVSSGCVVWEVPADGAPVAVLRLEGVGPESRCFTPAPVVLDGAGRVVWLRADGEVVAGVPGPDDAVAVGGVLVAGADGRFVVVDPDDTTPRWVDGTGR